MVRPFLDVPVYRLPRDDYYRRREEYVRKGLAPLQEQLGDQADKHRYLIDNFHQHFIDRFGGCWEFNEIVGYIRLHFLGGQVRGEYFAVRRKRLVRTRHKQFEWITHKLAGEADIERPLTDSTIESAVRRYLYDCQRELPRRHVDIEGFDVLAPHIRYRLM